MKIMNVNEDDPLWLIVTVKNINLAQEDKVIYQVYLEI